MNIEAKNRIKFPLQWWFHKTFDKWFPKYELGNFITLPVSCQSNCDLQNDHSQRSWQVAKFASWLEVCKKFVRIFLGTVIPGLLSFFIEIAHKNRN